MNLIRKYEETDQVERDVMQSLGYEWKNGGWQRGTMSINEDTMLTTAWVGPIPNKPKNPERPHIWDTPISEINQSSTNIFDNDDPPAPYPESTKNEERQEKDIAVKYYKELEQDVNYKLQTATQIKQLLQNEYSRKANSLSPVEKAEYQLNIAKKVLDEAKAQIAFDMAKVNRIQAEYSRLWIEFWYLSVEKPTSSNRRQWREAHEVAGKKNAEANPIKSKIENDKKRLLQLEKDVENKQEALKNERENEVKAGVKITSDFYEKITEKYGEQSAKIAKELADSVKGKQIRNVEQALQAFDKHKDSLNKKFSVQDREAICKALESLNRDEIAKNLTKFSKGFGFVSKAIDVAEWTNELLKAIRTNDWRPFFVKTETIGAGMAATTITAFAFSIVFAGPIGILGYAMVMTSVSVLVDDQLVEKFNKLIGI